jgi:5'(3')-deoxyribonucleotidase
MLKIALDFDNVLADTTGAWVRYYNKKYKKSIKKSDLTEYYFWNSLNISREEAFEIYSIVWSNWQNLDLLEEDCVSTVNELSEIAEVHVVTSALTDVKNWTAERGLKFNKIEYTQQKSELNYDIFIDDSPYVVLDILKRKKLCLLYDQPWNKSIESLKIAYILKKSNTDDLISNRWIQYPNPMRIKKLLEAVDVIKLINNLVKYG